MKTVLRAIGTRFREPSSWAGLSALGVVFGLPPGAVDAVLQAVVAVTGAAAILLPEKGPGA